tara:strand:+ start:1125 stop:2198 length:1074 start_codon:yes stop_codon:yes gene_type:complete
MFIKNKKFFYKHFGILISLIFIAFCIFISFFSYFLIPDDSQYSNQMHLSIHSMPPGFETYILEMPNSSNYNQSYFNIKFFGKKFPNKEIVIKNYDLMKEGIKFENYSNEKLFVEYHLFQPDLSVKEIEKKYIKKRIFIFGTDSFGRDVFGRVVLGTRVSLSIGFIAVLISLIIGLSIGMLGGYYGGLVDKIVMTTINVFWSIPTLLLVIAISVSLGKGFWQVYLAVGLTMWVEVARVVRGQVISEKNKDYIVATKVLGFSDIRIFIKHLLPNIIGPILIICAANFAAAILIESGLSFLGIGTQPPIPSWGSMIKDNYQFIILGKAYLAFIPGISIMLLVTSFMFLGNNLSDLFNDNK